MMLINNQHKKQKNTMIEVIELHNITPEKIVFCYRYGDADSLEVANYYSTKRLVPVDNLISLPCSNENIITYSEYISTIEIPLLSAIENLESNYLGSSEEKNIWVIILGYHIPHIYTYGNESFAIASRLHRLGKTRNPQLPNFTYDRRGSWKYFDADDVQDMYITAIIDGPTVAAAKTLIDRSMDVDNQTFITGKIYIDPYGLSTTDEDSQYQTDMLEWISQSINNLGLTVESTIEPPGVSDPITHILSHDSFYWGWFTPRYSSSLFIEQNERRAFLYNADDDAASVLSNAISTEGDAPWCNLAINVDPGYASCAGAVSAPGRDAYLRPRPFFEAMQRGASLGECFLYSSPYVDWKLVLVGDPLMVVNFPSSLPSDLDVSRTTLPNNEVIYQVKEGLEESIAWLVKQNTLLQNIIDFNCQRSDIEEEVYLLQNLVNWQSAKSVQSSRWILNKPVSTWRNYIFKTTGLSLDNWLIEQGEKVSEFLNDVLTYSEGGAVDSSLVYPEGQWEYVFTYIHPKSTLENVFFILQIALISDFINVAVEVNSSTDQIGWKYENEVFGFIQLTEYGFPSNFSGKRLRYTSTKDNYLDRTELYYIRWKAIDTNGGDIQDWSTETRIIIKR